MIRSRLLIRGAINFVRPIRHLVIISVIGLAVPAGAQDIAETRTAKALANAARGAVPEGAQLMLVPPPDAASPVDRDAVARIMQRIGLSMARRMPTSLDVLPQGEDLRETLATIRAREGMDSWRQAVKDLVRSKADLALSGAVRRDDEGLVLQLTLLSLEGRRVLATPPAIPIEPSPVKFGTADGAMRDAVGKMLQDAPEARVEVAILPFVKARSGLTTAAGTYLAEVAGEAWADAVQGVTETLRDAPAPSIREDRAGQAGYRLTGRIYLVDEDRFHLSMTLRGPGGLRTRQRLDIARAGLPPRVAAALAPEPRGKAPGFAAVRSRMGGLGQGRLRMTLDGGVTPTYRVCNETDPARLRARCDLLRLTLEADRPGAALCFSLGDDWAFALLVPNPAAAAPRLRANSSVTLPDALAEGEVVWPALGPPSAVLVGCLLYGDAATMPHAQLAEWSGTRLDARQIQRLAAILRDSAPRASTEAVVTIVAAEGGLLFRPGK